MTNPFMASTGPFAPEQMMQNPQPQQNFQQGFSGLMGNPMFGAGMGLLGAAHNRNINPYMGAMRGMMGSQVFKNQQQKYKLQADQQKLEFQQRDEVSKLAQQGLKTLDIDGDGNVSPQERDIGTYYRIAAGSGEAKDLQTAIKARTALLTPRDYTAKDNITTGPGGLPRYITGPSGGQEVFPGVAQTPPNVDPNNNIQWNDYLENLHTTNPDAYQRALIGKGGSGLGYDPESLNRQAGFKVREEFAGVYRSERGPARLATNKLKTARTKAKTLGTGVTGGARSWTDADLQEFQALLADIGLDRLGSLPVPLTPMSDPDIKLILSLSGSITNQPEANVALLDRAITAAQGIEADLDIADRWYRDPANDPVRNPGGLFKAQYENRQKLGLMPTVDSGQSEISVVDIASEAEAENLPKGTRIRLPDGRIGTVD